MRFERCHIHMRLLFSFFFFLSGGGGISAISLQAHLQQSMAAVADEIHKASSSVAGRLTRWDVEINGTQQKLDHNNHEPSHGAYGTILNAQRAAKLGAEAAAHALAEAKAQRREILAEAVHHGRFGNDVMVDMRHHHDRQSWHKWRKQFRQLSMNATDQVMVETNATQPDTYFNDGTSPLLTSAGTPPGDKTEENGNYAGTYHNDRDHRIAVWGKVEAADNNANSRPVVKHSRPTGRQLLLTDGGAGVICESSACNVCGC